MKTETLVAYHGDPKIKENYLARVRAHREADEMVKGVYWKDGKGCGVGCTIHSGNHHSYETELGIPEVLAHLEDAIFEGLPNGDAKAWPERFLSAIKPGADLSLVWPRFALWLLVDPADGVIKYAGEYRDVDKAIRRVGDLYREWTEGRKPDKAAWAAARAAARDAARAAAGDAARAAAWAAAWSAARAAAGDAARAAAGAAARAAAGDAAWDAAFRRMADKLVELLEAA